MPQQRPQLSAAALPLLLPLLLVLTQPKPPAAEAVTIGDICSGGGGLRCNFTWLEAQLQSRSPLAPGRVGGALASALVSLNMRLRKQLLDAAECAKRWLSRPPGAGCYDLCCPDPTLGGLVPALDRVKSDVKQSFTRLISSRQSQAAYQSAAFDILNVFSGVFLDFVRQLAVDSSAAHAELATFGVFYAKLQRDRPMLAVGATCGAAAAAPDGGRNGSSGRTEADGQPPADCESRGQLWLNAVGVSLQNLVMCEVAATGDAEAAWQVYLAVTDCVTQAALACERAAMLRGGRGGGSGGGGGDNPVATAGLSGSDIALIVLIPTLLILLAVAVGVAVRASRRRRRHWQLPRQDSQQQQQHQNEHAAAAHRTDGAGCESAMAEEASKDFSDAQKQRLRRRQDGQPDGEAAEAAAPGESAAMVRPDSTATGSDEDSDVM